MTVTAELLDVSNVEAYAPSSRTDSKDQYARGLMYFFAGDGAQSKDYMQKSLDAGMDELQADLRAQIIAEAEDAMRLRFGGYEGVYLLQSQQELADAMQEMELDSPGEAVIRLLNETERV